MEFGEDMWPFLDSVLRFLLQTWFGEIVAFFVAVSIGFIVGKRFERNRRFLLERLEQIDTFRVQLFRLDAIPAAASRKCGTAAEQSATRRDCLAFTITSIAGDGSAKDILDPVQWKDLERLAREAMKDGTLVNVDQCRIGASILSQIVERVTSSNALAQDAWNTYVIFLTCIDREEHMTCMQVNLIDYASFERLLDLPALLAEGRVLLESESHALRLRSAYLAAQQYFSFRTADYGSDERPKSIVTRRLRLDARDSERLQTLLESAYICPTDFSVSAAKT